MNLSAVIGKLGRGVRDVVYSRLDQRARIFHHNRWSYPTEDHKRKTCSVPFPTPMPTPPVCTGRGPVTFRSLFGGVRKEISSTDSNSSVVTGFNFTQSLSLPIPPLPR